MTSTEGLHLISALVEKKAGNVFIWYPLDTDTAEIRLSWRADDQNPLTVAKLYRYVDTVVKEEYGINYKDWPYTLLPVAVEPSGVIRYRMRYKSNPPTPLIRDSDDYLEPGDYGLYMPDHSKKLRQPFIFMGVWTFFDEYQAIIAQYPRLASPPSTALRDAALKIQGGKCLFTGISLDNDQDDTVAIWYLPPYFSYLIDVTPLLERSEIQEEIRGNNNLCVKLENIGNCLVTSQKIAELLWENEVAVDVEDGYRIVYFDQRTSDTPNFKSHLQFPNSQNRLNDDYIRGHFKYSLQRNIQGGDIRSDYPLDAPEDFITSRNEELEEEDEEEYNFDDEVWKTGVGKLVYDWLLRYPDLYGEF